MFNYLTEITSVTLWSYHECDTGFILCYLHYCTINILQCNIYNDVPQIVHVTLVSDYTCRFYSAESEH